MMKQASKWLDAIKYKTLKPVAHAQRVPQVLDLGCQL